MTKLQIAEKLCVHYFSIHKLTIFIINFQWVWVWLVLLLAKLALKFFKYNSYCFYFQRSISLQVIQKLKTQRSLRKKVCLTYHKEDTPYKYQSTINTHDVNDLQYAAVNNLVLSSQGFGNSFILNLKQIHCWIQKQKLIYSLIYIKCAYMHFMSTSALYAIESIVVPSGNTRRC